MSKILLQTTIAEQHDWDITRFSLLADELRATGHDVTARNRANRADDPLVTPTRIFDNVYAIGRTGTVVYAITTSAGIVLIAEER